MRTDRRTDITKLIVAFPYFANAPKKKGSWRRKLRLQMAQITVELRIWIDSHLFSARNSRTEKAERTVKFSCWGKQSCEFHFQAALALHFPADAMSCQCSNVPLQFVFLEQSHNIPKEAIFGSLFLEEEKDKNILIFMAS